MISIRDPLSCRVASSKITPVSLMRLSETKDVDELLKDHNREDIIVEEKLDGWKTQVIKDGGEVRLFSRRGEEKTENVPDIVDALKHLPDGTLMEGELVYWHEGKQDVTKVISVAGSSPDKAQEKIKELPGQMKLHLYDVLKVSSNSVSDKPFHERRKLLEKHVKPSKNILLTKQYSFADWQKAMNKAVEANGEGIVLKLKSEKYHWKPSGQNEPKPAGIMWKYKGGVGKSDSDDYVVYDHKTGDKGKLKAQFGQYYDKKLYHISEISNFSAENESEIKSRLKKGPFVIEIGFQERVPKGLRHQKFERFRDDKKPKDATMHEFHVKHIKEFKQAANYDALIAKFGSIEDLIKALEKAISSRDLRGVVESLKIGPSALSQVPGMNIDMAYKIISSLESKNRFKKGDSGTSFGTVQVRIDGMLRGLAADPLSQKLTGISPSEFKRMASAWESAKRKLTPISLWKVVPVDEEAVKRTIAKGRRYVSKRREGTTIRHFPGGVPGIVKLRGGKMTGYALNTEALERAGLRMTPYARARINRILLGYVTGAVVRNAIAKIMAVQREPISYAKFARTFSAKRVNKSPALRGLTNRVAQRNFVSRARAVADAVSKSGYDTSAPGAYNIYQLIAIANAGGLGPIRNFLFRKRPFPAGNIHYLHRANKMIEKVSGEFGEKIESNFPPGKGMGGFSKSRKSAALMRIAIMKSDQKAIRKQADDIKGVIGRWLNYDPVSVHEIREAGLTHLGLDSRSLVVSVCGNVEELKKRLPNKMSGLDIRVISGLASDSGFLKDQDLLVKNIQAMLKDSGQYASDTEVKIAVLVHLANKLGTSKKELKSLFKGEDIIYDNLLLSKRAFDNDRVIAFPGSHAEDIKAGKREVTIRPADIPVEVDEVVTAVTYSGAPICKIRIISKERMSIIRVRKAFGERVADSLETRFGPNSRFMVVRFYRFDTNNAEDEDDEKKWDEVLIDKEGTSLTRKYIRDHYSKPAVRKSIMSRIKGKPILIYLGIGKNEKVLKRNHGEKQIVISDDNQKNDENPNNYWYWVKRRLLSIHEVFGPKTKLGFVDLDLHGGYSIEEARKYASKLSALIKKEYGSSPNIYQSGGTGLHVEFNLKETSTDKLRSELKSLLDELNEDFEGVKTGVVKGKGMRTDISTLHDKGSLRVPGSLGETYGKIKKKVGSKVDDDYGNNNFGGKPSDTGPFGDGGAITPQPYISVSPGFSGAWHAAEKRKMIFHGASNDRT
jgi:hypothetical protein